MDGVNLQGAFLCRSYFRGADLHQAQLQEGRLGLGDDPTGREYGQSLPRWTDLGEADLTAAGLARLGGKFGQSLPRWTNLGEADLTEANLYRADLTGANLTETSLKDASLDHAVVSGAYFQLRRDSLPNLRTFGLAAGLDLLITSSGRSASLAYAVDGLAAFLLTGIAARMLSFSLPGAGETARPDTRTVLSCIVAAAILAAAAATGTYDGQALGHFAWLVDIPAICVTVAGFLTVPVIVAERLGAGRALLRSWQLIRGNGWALLVELGKLYPGFVLVMIIPATVISGSSVAMPQTVALLGLAGGILYGPLAALTLALSYFRLAEARHFRLADAGRLAPQTWRPASPANPRQRVRSDRSARLREPDRAGLAP